MSAGRLTDYNEEIAVKLCLEMAAGRKLRDICADPDMPCEKAVFLWLGRHPQFVQQYARARELQVEPMFEDMLNIADAPVASSEEAQRARLRVDTRKWALSKMLPRKYGDKITTEATGNMTLTVKTGVPRKGRSE